MNFYLDRNMSIFLKGIAIILMVFHHSFGSPSWYIESIAYPELFRYTWYITLSGGFLVVPMFAFLTGWSYFFHKDKSFKYSLKKIIYFLISYWIIYIPFLLIAIVICGYKPNIIKSILELFGFFGTIMHFAWYVYFYIVSMLFLPLYVKFFPQKNFYVDFVCIVIIGILIKHLSDMIEFTYEGIKPLTYIGNNLPIVLMGYLCGKYKFLDKIYQIVIKNINYIIRVFLSWLIIFAMLVMYIENPIIEIGTGIIYTPIFLVCAFIINIYRFKYLNKILHFLAIHSMNIWFLHCIFFSEITRELFQPIAYLPHNPILVVIWILLLCSMVSIIVKKVQDFAISKAEKLFC